MSKGYVYILTNPSLREVACGEREMKKNVSPVKIGMTEDVPHRMGTLNTSTPQNFVDELIVELSSEKDALVLENMVHEKLEDFRIVNDDGATEFFNCTVALAKEAAKLRQVEALLLERSHIVVGGNCSKLAYNVLKNVATDRGRTASMAPT